MNKNMSDTLPVICENAGRTIEVAMGTTLLEVDRPSCVFADDRKGV